LAWAAALAALLAAGGAHAQSRDCAGLAGMVIPAAQIGLPTAGATVTSARLERGDKADSVDSCVVLGRIAPVDARAPFIHFRVNLPTVWNGKALHQGGGGYDGALVTGRNPSFVPADREPVRLGYASFGSDGGHQAQNTDASFALNGEAAVNFGNAQLKKTHDVALAIITRFYGSKPRRTYFIGNSQGGHEGFIVAQRWPLDYDGVVAIHPAYNFTALQLSGLITSRALYQTPEHFVNPAKAKMLATAVYAKCDALDGLKDGVIANVAACRRAFDVASLRCPGGKDSGDSCLSDPQIATLRAYAAPVDFGMDISGSQTFGGWPVLEGALGEGSFFGLGTRAVPGKPPVPPTDAFGFVMADQGVRFMMVKDAAYDSLRFVPTEHAAEVRTSVVINDASSIDLEAFRKHGGKMLLMHGTVDMAIPPSNSIMYYDRIRAKYGAALPGFLRFYIAPGFGHGDGPYVLNWASLDALDAWVDQGRAPGPQTVTDIRSGKGARPLCEYPTWPKYVGGDVKLASSFRCVR
jgi:feruloyl esterase